MTPELAAFSDWVLVLLPRFLIYPGALWMVAGVAFFRVAGGGIETLRLRRLLHDVAGLDVAAAAVAWAALATMPMPGATSLPAPVDRWVTAAMLALSLVLSLREAQGVRIKNALAGTGLTLALLAPLAGGNGLLLGYAALEDGWAARLGFFAVVLGIIILREPGTTGIDGDIRHLAWLALALAPLWPYFPDNWPLATVAVFAVAYLSGRISKLLTTRYSLLTAHYPAIQWLLVGAALLAGLLHPR